MIVLAFVTTATWFVASNVAAQSAQDTAILQHRWDTMFGEGFSLSDATLDSAVSRYSQLVYSIPDGLTEAFSVALSLDESYILLAEAQGRPRGLFPDITEQNAVHVIQLPERDFMRGAAFYQNMLYTEAIEAFQSAIDELPIGSKARNLAHLNLAAALNEEGKVIEAIELLEKWLIESEEHAIKLPRGLAERARVNLAGLQVSSRAYHAALKTLQAVDTSRLESYWQAIQAANTMIAHHELRQFPQRDSVWNQSNVFDAIELIPNETFQGLALHQILLTRDFTKYQAFLTLLHDQNSPLLEVDGRYTELLAIETSDSRALQQFVWFAELAEMEDKYLLQLEEDARAHAPDFEAIQLSLERQVNRNKRLTWILLVSAGFLAIAGAVGYRIRYSLQQRKSKALEKVINAPRSNNVQPWRVPITDDDIRTLGDSIAYGRRISDAMMVLKKLKANMDTPEVQVTGAELNQDLALKLNESEQLIASHILAGFDAKESSRILDVTPEYIYNLRSRIRGKLEIPSGVKMEAWLLEKHASPNGEQTTK